MAKATLVLLPIWATGHFMSMLEAGKRLLEHLNSKADANTDHPFCITVLVMQPQTPEYVSNIDNHIRQVETLGLDIRFYRLPFVEPPHDCVGVEEFTSRYVQVHAPHIKAAITGLYVPAAALVIDLFATTVIDVARELSLPSYVYFASNGALLALMLRLPALHEEVTTEFEDMEGAVHVPGMPPLPRMCMPSTVMSKKNPNYTWFVYHGNSFMEADGIIVNTVALLEQRVLHAISEGQCVPGRPAPPVYPIGPVISSLGSFNNDRSERHKCLNWLDKQPPASVVYLCFGSMGWLGAPQVQEMAVGLECSGHRFLWALRGQPPSGSRHPADTKPEEVLPRGFLDRTKDRGLVWPSWAPQKDILEHGATGAFVTHCGWNSCLESIWFGVPLIPWPLYAEQHLNAFRAVTEIGIGIEMRVARDKGNFVEAAELEKAVRCLMGDSEEGRRVREKAQVMKVACRKAVEKGGSSYASLQRLSLAIQKGK